MFIEHNEHLIIMEEHVSPLTPFDLALLAGCGVKTVYYQASVRWQEMQPSESAGIDWRELDRRVEQAQKAGLRSLVPFVHELPTWKPDDWYFTRDGLGIPNYQNPQTGADLDEFARAIIARYPPEWFQLIYGMPADGEFPVEFWPYTNTLPFPNHVLADWVVARQRVLEAQHGEVWTAFHHYTGPVWIDDVYRALAGKFPNSRHYGIAFTHFVHNRPETQKALRHMRDAYGMRYFAGSEYVQGLRGHTGRCIGEGVWGFITCPTHSYQQYRTVEPWMLPEIALAMRELEKAHA